MFLLLLAVAIFFSVLLGEKLAASRHTTNRAQAAGVHNGQQAVAGQNLARQVHDQCLAKGAVAKELGPLCTRAAKVAAAKPSPVPGVNNTVIPGPIGPQGVQGLQGIPGVPGPSGASGSSVTGPIGVPGLNGLNGQDGTGAPGPAGPPGANGANGVDGSPGASGASGANGVDGQPPQSFTFTYVDTLGATQTETCRRNDPFDPAQPQYTCEVTP